MARRGTARRGSANGEIMITQTMFKPKNVVAYWKMLYDIIVDRKLGDLVTYDEITEIVGKEVNNSRVHIYRANKELVDKNNRMLEVVPTVGYRIVEGLEMYKGAENHKTKSKRQIKQSTFIATHIDTAVLTPDQKTTLSNFLTHNQEIANVLNQKIDRAGVATQYAAMAGKRALDAAEFTLEELTQLKEILKTRKV